MRVIKVKRNLCLFVFLFFFFFLFMAAPAVCESSQAMG